MSSLRQFVAGVLVGGGTLLATGNDAMAQRNTSRSTAGVSSTRGDWQRRVLRQGPTRPPGTRLAAASTHRLAQYPTPARTAPALGGAEEHLNIGGEPAQPDQPDHRLPEEGLPEDTAYDPSPAPTAETIFEPDATAHPSGCSECADCGGDPYCDQSSQCYDGCDGGCGACLDCSGADYMWGVPKPLWMQDLSLFAGVHGFKGPADLGRNGNFGLQEGVNFGSAIGGPVAIGFQVGLTAVQSNFFGDQTDQSLVLQQGLDITTADRDQVFFTAGVFHRALCGGWQGGVALDLLHEAYYDRGDLTQLRAELGYVFIGGRREIGYFGSYGTGSDTFRLADQSLIELEPTDMSAFYYRRYFQAGGEGRLWAGFTGRRDALLGAELLIPVGHSWAIENRANFLIPRQRRGSAGQPQESWGLTIQLVWYPGQPARCAGQSLFRPLFSVADNATFMSDVLRR